MALSEAAQRLVYHAQPEPGSFFGMLRPYKGLRKEVLDDLWAVLRSCADDLKCTTIDRELVSALWAISFLGRSWGLEPNGMLRRNGLISDQDQSSLCEFLHRFDYAVMVLLEGGEEEEAFGGELGS